MAMLRITPLACLMFSISSRPVSAFNILISCAETQCTTAEPVVRLLEVGVDTSIDITFLAVNGSSLYDDIANYCSSNHNKVSAILDMTDSCQLSELSFVSHVPYLTLSTCPGISTSIAPDTSVYIRAILEILRSQGISTQQMAVFADSDSDMTELLSLADMNDTVQIRALDISPDSGNFGKDRLQWAVNSRQVCMIGNRRQIRTLLKQICQLKNIPQSTTWSIVSIDADIDECYGCDFNNTIYLRPSIRNQTLVSELRAVLGIANLELGYAVYEAAHVLHQHWQEMVALNSSTVKLEFDLCVDPFLSDNKTEVTWDDNEVTEYMHSYGTTTWTGEEFEQNYRIGVGRYGCHNNGSSTEMIGTWTPGDLKWMVGGTLWEPEPLVLRITTVPEPPFVNRLVHENGTVSYTGYSIDVLDEIARRMKVDYTISEPEDGQFGAVLPDGDWTGMIGKVHRKSADMAVGPISVTAEREQVVDFATPYYDFAGIQIMIKKTEVESSMFTFTTVFSIEVWLCWFSVLGATAILLHAFDRLSHCKCGSREAPRPDREGFDLKDSFWFVIASLTLSGPEKRPRSFSSRILVTGFWFFCSIMMATYTANLAALLTLSRLSAPVANLEDLLAQSKIRYSTMEGTSMQTYFRRMAEIETNFYEIWKEMSYGNDTDESTQRSRYAVWDYPLPDRYKVIWQQMEETGFVNSTQQGIDRVLKGDYAYFTEAPMIKYKMSLYCDITAVGNQFSAKPYAFALQEKSSKTSVVSGIILELQQERILETLKQKWWPEVTASCGSVDTSEGVGILEMAGIFMLVGAGVVCGILTLFVELLIHKIVQTTRKKKKKSEANDSSVSNSTENYRVSLDLSEMSTTRENT